MLHPPAFTVQLYTRQLTEKHGQIAGATARIEKAAAILIAGDVTRDGSQFFVASSKGDGTGYHVGSGCECADYANGAPQIGSRRYCKHKLAVAMLKRHIRESAQPRIQIGDPGNLVRVAAIKGRNESPYLYRLNEMLTNFYQTTVKLAWSDQLFDFQPSTDADYLILAHWLEFAPPMPAPRRESIFDRWNADYNGEYSTRLPFLEWQEIYGKLYADLRTQ